MSGGKLFLAISPKLHDGVKRARGRMNFPHVEDGALWGESVEERQGPSCPDDQGARLPSFVMRTLPVLLLSTAFDLQRNSPAPLVHQRAPTSSMCGGS